jgi:enterochelin esterase-like enzyme
MSVAVKSSRTQVWLENLGEWSWPGTSSGGAVEVLPPSWVPTFPPRLEPAVAGPGATAAPGVRQPGRAIARRLAWGAVAATLAVLCVALALEGPRSVERSLGIRTLGPSPSIRAAREDVVISRAAAASARSLPTLTVASQDAAGSSIDAASYPSAALHGSGSFLVYLPAGYASTTRHYPVLYLLTGNDQSDTAFLQVGLQGELDRLIARHTIPPLIAVMIQGGPGTNNWHAMGGRHYEAYAVEVQELVDRMLPTLANRGGRAIAGDSMGGYGAMSEALAYPYRFGVVESWLGFFNGLEGQLRADQPIISRLGLHAFVFGGAEDTIANPEEDAPFAAALRAAGASAHSAVYPGEHSLETVHAHLPSMLVYAGRALSRDAEPVS